MAALRISSRTLRSPSIGTERPLISTTASIDMESSSLVRSRGPGRVSACRSFAFSGGASAGQRDRTQAAGLGTRPATGAQRFIDRVNLTLFAADSVHRADFETHAAAFALGGDDMGSQESLAATGGTTLVHHVGKVLVAEQTSHCQHRIGRRLAKTTERALLNRARQLFEEIQRFERGLAVDNIV